MSFTLAHHESIQQEIEQRFKGVWLGPTITCCQILVVGAPSLNGLDFDRNGIEEAASLEEVFSVEEVYSAFLKLNEDKASGPDGFPLVF
ncbi:hypothetical protein CK203_043871 [Vitis vinifera]|uniref:Uncharacterized protein n=1 Tax=Vitis vinifera TaxID=29760 RepID=A0A438HVC4_VITVI|nr:hypothetical protein CK203_043871 [Vitis vinifera]